MWTLTLAGMTGVSVLPDASRADTITFAADQTIVSVGDPITVRFTWTATALPAGSPYTFTYSIPSGSQYAPNSIALNSMALADTDSRITIATDSVRVALGNVPIGSTTVTLRLRATGSIGTALPHFGALLGRSTTQELHGYATHIEDENATVLLPTLQQDTYISASPSNYNYGGAARVELKTSDQRRGLLKLDMASVNLPGTHEVAAAYLEVFPDVPGSTGVTINVYRVRRTWTEGTQTGAPCTAGASWTRRDCINSWTSGGDYDSSLRGAGFADQSTRFVSINLRSMAEDWLEGWEEDEGIVLIPSASMSNTSMSFASKEGASVGARAARLVIVIAPNGTYATKGVKSAAAEIVPNYVTANVPNQRFVYTVKPEFDPGQTGMNRIAIAIPTPFSLVSVDTVKSGSSVLNRNQDETLIAGEFEVFGFGSTLDVRFAPPVTSLTGDRHINVIFRAGTPLSTDFGGKSFTSTVDHDRRGYAAQNAAAGNANDRSGDGDTWVVRTLFSSIVSVVVTPTDTTVSAGSSVQYRARANYSNGTSADVTNFATWSVLPPAGTWEAPGLIHTTTQAEASVSANFSGTWSAPVPLHVGPPALLQLWITPKTASMVAGLTHQYEAYGRYSTQDTLLVTASAVWTIADTAIARVQSPGLVRGKKSGSTQLSASLSSKVASSATVDVTPAELVSIEVAPADTSVALGYSQQLHAWGTYTDGSRIDLRSVATWQVNPPGVIDIDADGLATTLAVGTAAMTAGFGAVTSPATNFTVLPPALVSIVVTPADTSIALGLSVQMRATGKYSDGSSSDITSSVSWQTTPAGLVSLAANGLATALAQGTTQIRATQGIVTSSAANFTVLPVALISIAVTPADTAVVIGSTGMVRATGSYSNGSTANLTSQALWQAMPLGLIAVDSSGTVTTLATGTVMLTATHSSVTSPVARFVVNPVIIPILDSLRVDPCPVELPPGTLRQLTAWGYFDGSSTADLTTQVTWSTDDSAVASVDSIGRLTAHQSGNTFVRVTQGLVSAACSVVVDASVLDTFVITPADTTVRLGDPMTYRATGSVGSDIYDLTQAVVWSSSDTLVATIAAGGIVSTRAPGTIAIGARLDSVQAPAANLRVDPATVVAVEVLPAVTSVRLGSTKAMTARARYSNNVLVDVTSTATWVSSAPGIAFITSNGVATGIAVGSTSIIATYAAVVSPAADLTVLPAVQAEAIATGTRNATPGAVDQLLLTLRLSNRYLDARRLTALQVQTSGPISQLRLRVDDNDGIFEPLTDPVLAEGVPSGSQWTAANLNLQVPLADTRTLFVSGQVSLDAASQNDSIDIEVPRVGALFWEDATAVTAAGFPLDSEGILRVAGFVLRQVQTNPVAADSVRAGTTDHLVLDLRLPDDGGREDTLEQLFVDQLGTARASTEITSMRVLVGPSPWSEVGELVYTGGRRWSTNGLAITVPVGGRPIRLVTDVALTAEPQRTVQVQLPLLAASFASGRVGPVDSAYVNPGSLTIGSPHTLIVENSPVVTSGVIQRTARQVPVLGIRLTAYAAEIDTLLGLGLVNTTTGATGPASNPNGQIASAALWLDTNADGYVDASDPLLESVTPTPGNVISFGTAAQLRLPLANGTPATLLVTMDPDSTAVRDDEHLSVTLPVGGGLDSAKGLSVQIQGLVTTLVTPIVDGQAGSGCAVRAIESRILLVGSNEFLVLDFIAPANGVEDDVLTSLRIENAGSATRTDIAALTLRRDDGNGIFDAADSVVTTLASTGQRTWESPALSLPLFATNPPRLYVTARAQPTALAGGTFQARVPLEGIRVASGNDAPNDTALDGGGPIVLTVGNQVTLLAGIAGFHSVSPEARKQVVMVLESFNGYSSPRHLSALTVTMRGTAAPSEYDTWALYEDVNQNGHIDDTELAIGIASPASETLRFEGLDYQITPLQQQRLLVTYTLAPGSARDGSVVDAVILNAESFEYSDPDQAVTVAQFPMDSPGEDTIDGHLVRQIANHSLTSQTLGGGETHVLTLDLTLPSNGWDPDVLEALEVQLSVDADAAIFGEDITAMRLWREQGTNPVTARFDPSEDLLLRSLLPGESQLRFEALGAAIPTGGHRYYVTVDISPTIVDGRRIQLLIPSGGITMQSGNDGPLDAALTGKAIHQLSASDLLATASVPRLQVSRGQILNLRVGVRNRGSVALDGVVPLGVDWSPPLPVTLVSGPSPASLTLASGASDTLAYEFVVNTAGETQCIVTVGMPDSTVVGNPASSPLITVQEPPSGLELEPLSNLPTTVSRGQANTVPVIWNFTHPDSAALTAPIFVRSLRLEVENATGGSQSAAAVFSRLECRVGGQAHAVLDTVSDSSEIYLQLDPELVLVPGEAREVFLLGTIAPAASASSFRLRVTNAATVTCGDVNSGQPVALTATLPWTSNLTLIRTEASQVDVAFEHMLPAAANRGQQGVPVGRITFTLPGSAGESEARITQLALAIRDPGGQPIDPGSFIERLEVRSGAATLLSTTQLDTVAGRLLLPLTIQKSIASGAPESLDLSLDLRADALAGPFAHWIPDAAALVVLDAISGAALAIVTTSPDSLPFDLGSFVVQSPAPDLSLVATSRAPATTPPGAVQFPVAGFHFEHVGAPGSADALLRAITFRTLDAAGNSVEPRDLLQSARLMLGSTTIASVGAPPAGSTLVRFDLATPLRIAPGAQLDLDLDADLSPSLAEPLFRFAFESTAFEVADANDAAQLLFVTGTIPFATPLVQTVQPTTAVAFGPTDDPPANAPRGAAGFPLLSLRVAHPGSASQAPLILATLTVLVRDAAGTILPSGAVASAARLRAGSSTIEGTMIGDSLRFDLTGLAAMDGGTHIDLDLDVDVLAAPAVSDLRLAIDLEGLAATSGGRMLTIQALAGATLPYLSPAIHLTAANLQESVSNYPNPFIAGRESTRIAFFLPEPAEVSAEIYALDGTRVIRLLTGANLAAGLHDDLEWNGRNGEGQLVRNGTYLLKLQASGPHGGKLLRKLAVKR